VSQRLGGRDREHAGAGADIENAARAVGAQNLIQRKQAAAGGAVMAGTEGQCSFDLNAYAMRWNGCAVMRAMHHETASGDRLQPREARRHPVARRDGFEA
jgi:hypothetical protein